MNGLPVFLLVCIREIPFGELYEGDCLLRVFLVFYAHQFSACLWKAWEAVADRGGNLDQVMDGEDIHLGLVAVVGIRLDLADGEYNHLVRIGEEGIRLSLVAAEDIHLGLADAVYILDLLAGAENKEGDCRRAEQIQVFGNGVQRQVDVRVGLSKSLLYRIEEDSLLRNVVEAQNISVVAQGVAVEGVALR